MGGLAIVGALVAVAGCGRLGFNAPHATDGPGGEGHGDGPPMPTGTYVVSPAVTYSCALGVVDISFTQLAFADSGTALTVTSNDTGNPAQPCPMMGTSAAGGHIDVTCTLPGSCNETYSLVGDFTGPTGWSGTFRADYNGICVNCTAQMFAVTGTR